MLPDAIRKLLKKDFSKLYGIEIENIRLFREYKSLRLESGRIDAGKHLYMCFAKISYRRESCVCVYKDTDGAQDAEGFLENPSISPALISYSTELPFYTLSAYAGKSFNSLSENQISEELLTEIVDNFLKLKRPHGDLDSVNFVLNEVPFNGPAITMPDPNKKVLFIDYSDYGAEEERIVDITSLLSGLDYLSDQKFEFLVRKVSEGLGETIDTNEIEKTLIYQLGGSKKDFEKFIERLSKALQRLTLKI